MQPVTDINQISKIIRKTRRSQKIDQATFALICGFSERPLKAVEAGRGTLTVDKLLTIFEELGIKMYVEAPTDE